MGAHVAYADEVLPRDAKRVRARVNAVQMAHPWRNLRGPTPATAAGIESNRTPWQTIPREHGKILVECPDQLGPGNLALIETPPLPAKVANGCLIEIHGTDQKLMATSTANSICHWSTPDQAH